MEKMHLLEISLEQLRKFFLAELTILRGVSEQKLKGRAFEVRVLMSSACSTGTALVILGDDINRFYGETMMLARCFIEKVTNYCYLQVCDDIEFEKFLYHPFYKMYHNCDRSKHTTKGKLYIKFTGKEELKKDPRVSKALKLFSENNSRKDWSDLNVDQKIALIAEKTNISTEFFLISTLSVYSNSSEALHGSLYGCALPTFAFTPNLDPHNKEEAKENLFKNMALLYIQLGTLIDELVKSISQNAIEEYVIGSEKNLNEALKIFKSIFDKKNSS